MKSVTLPVLLCVGLPFCSAADWPQWRGPDRSGVSKETGLLKKWPQDGPQLIWEAKGAGRGYASVAISKGRVYTLGDGLSTADDKDEYVTCFDDTSGQQQWKTKLGPAWNSGSPSWQSSRSTPTLDGERLYVVTPHGVLFCLNTADGKEQWKKDLKKEFGGTKGDSWGYSESPLVDGDKLIVTPGGPKNTVVALDKKTGEKLWSCAVDKDRGAGHASVVVSEPNQVRVYVTTTAGGALGVRASDGKLMWTYPIDRSTAVIPTPIIKGDLVFFTAGYGRGGALLKQVPDGEGAVKVEEVYGLKVPLNNRHGGVLLIGDHIYGDTDNTGVTFSAEFKTGQIEWKERPKDGKQAMSLASADGKLYMRFANGVMVLAEVNPKKFVEISSFKIPGSGERPSWSHPVICNGRLYLREGDKILCYDIKDK